MIFRMLILWFYHFCAIQEPWRKLLKLIWLFSACSLCELTFSMIQECTGQGIFLRESVAYQISVTLSGDKKCHNRCASWRCSLDFMSLGFKFAMREGRHRGPRQNVSKLKLEQSFPITRYRNEILLTYEQVDFWVQLVSHLYSFVHLGSSVDVLKIHL